MSVVEHYQGCFDQARELCEEQKYERAKEAASVVVYEAQEVAKHFEGQPGFLRLARQLTDIAIHAKVLLLFIEQRLEREQYSIQQFDAY